MTVIKKWATSAIVAFLGIQSAVPLEGADVAYVNRVAFDAASSGPLEIINFDSSPVGNVSTGSSIGGVTFNYDFGGPSLNITNAFVTTSVANSLGTNDGNLLQDGDNITFTFSPRTGFGLYIISADPLQNNDFHLTVGSSTAFLSASAVQQTLSDSSKVWFLGVQSNNGSLHTTALLTTHGGGGTFLYNLDDVVLTTVPEPGTISLILCASTVILIRVGCASFNRRQRVNSRRTIAKERN